MSQKFERPNPVSEDYEALFLKVGGTQLDWPRQALVAQIGVKMGWDLTEAIQEFSHSTQRLGRVNTWLTGVIALATLVYALVEVIKLARLGG